MPCPASRAARLALPLSALLALGLATACSSQDDATDAAGTAPAASPSPTASPTASPAASAEEWSYDGATGPQTWGDVAASCAAGATGSQSPIDLDEATMTTSATETPVSLAMTAVPYAVFNNGHTVEAVPEEPGNAFTVDGVTYQVAQFHFHHGSEHTLDGAGSAMEMHVVGKSDAGATAVLGVLLDVGAQNGALGELFANLPSTVTDEDGATALTTPIDLSAVIPSTATVARYTGSLTTPPCTEGVVWDVYLTPQTISQGQLDAFAALYPDNERPVQALNGRAVFEVAGS
ncbi:carbonic anhydrase family protein [Xylanimonas allomyrinae]|uniref:Carbonic anhydrase family protein n=1 Tax=Xylanimonas allomyrinae TaxID=2509459 RepID=A0A4P6ENX4_9MICO|nr:carbonic anhydrase family protein [Xylanimonas allomyrinae]QAY64146.1 carbonic anhydrase family protein [Xylanimonas allomyrinae]